MILPLFHFFILLDGLEGLSLLLYYLYFLVGFGLDWIDRFGLAWLPRVVYSLYLEIR